MAFIRLTKKTAGISLTLFALSCLSWHAYPQDFVPQNRLPIMNWHFARTGDSAFLPAIVPGTVHTDLFRNGIIPDPFFACNEKSLQWIGQTSWTYRTEFRVSAEIAAQPSLSLVLEGLDTYARVSVNGSEVLTTDNMFIPWKVNCQGKVREGWNQIEIEFEPALLRFLQDSALLGYPLPGGRWNTSRKAAYHFGWDWGPRLITSGIWKPVYLEWNAGFKAEYIHLHTLSADTNHAVLEARIRLQSDQPRTIRFLLKDAESKAELINTLLEVPAGTQIFSCRFAVDKPRLWWTHELGEPCLYRWIAEFSGENNLTASQTLNFGIRQLELVQDKDETGSSFYFRLNGIPLYIKGANTIPQHSFLTEVTDEDYKRLISSAKDAHMNMLRVWGGGIYEKDIFYDLCDQAGILVWQDFMYACALYPGTRQFLQSAKKEAEFQIERLRNHPCLALWCGNNESDEAWHNWGYQKQYQMSPETQDTIWKHYQKLFHQILPDAVHNLDPGRPYISTSPSIGWGHPESLTSGDSHYWGVWWGHEPFETYSRKIPRFMSEFGFQSMPGLALIKSILPNGQDTLFSPALRCHQKHPTGYETIAVYLEREKLNPKTLEHYIYHTQLLQTHGIGMGIEAQRSSRPHCMGSLYWQLNDCWPVTSWSSLDCLGNRKALHYHLDRLYDDVLLSFENREDEIILKVVSDRLNSFEGDLSVRIRNFEGGDSLLRSHPIPIPGLTASVLFKWSRKDLLTIADPESCLLEARLADRRGRVYSSDHFMVPPGALRLPEVSMETTILQQPDGFRILIKSNAFAAYVYLYLTEDLSEFSRNFFHIRPGEIIETDCRTILTEEEFRNQLKILHLKNTLIP